MKVLITGHCGFLGRRLFQACAERGYAVLGVDTAEPLGSTSVDELRVLRSDCRDFFRSPDEYFDLVFHAAATVGGRATIDGNPLAVATNLSLDAEMFNWAMRTRPACVVYFSSSAAYPVDMQMVRGLTGQWRRLSEGVIEAKSDTIGRPDQTYGLAKLVGEILAQQVNDAGIPVHVFRPFSGHGTDQSPDYPFRAFIDRALRRDDPFEVWGDGTQVRDWIHVDDIVGAVFAAIDVDERGPVNLCTGQGTAMGDLAELVCEMAGYTPQFKFLPDRPTGVHHRVGDPARMLRFYTPKVALHEGVRRALRELAA